MNLGAIALVMFMLFCGQVFAQGNLEPSATPGPTMKTLNQVEPRTPISAAQTIAASGSYYLTQNISGNLFINADNVELDLNGFTLSAGNPNGVTINGKSDIRIFNGTIINPQTAGVAGPGVSDVHLQDLRISGGVNCVSFFNPAGQVVVSQINCKETAKAGIIVLANSTLPLVALIHDNVVSNTNMDGIAPGASIYLPNAGTNDGSYMEVRNNRVYDSKLACMVVFNGPTAEASAGTVSDNSTSFCQTGLVVVGNFFVTKNFAQYNELEDYNFDDAPNAAAIIGINDSPGPWNNIADQTPSPEG